ncbi:MAG TPA: glutamyl-tRNA reductase [Ignavibacteriaceae bacterium]|nr:glutamyl-tRNA reductase [Ignavibacteriaceae bacterium]
MKDDELRLVVIGISHKTSTISEREIFQINRKEMRGALNYFKSLEEVEGVVIVATCNRLEFYLVIRKPADPFLLIKEFYLRSNIEILFPELFYSYGNTEAARHLFKVITGLDSIVIGEYQVQGQIKDAYSIACSEKTPDKILHKLFHSAFRTGKAVRSGTNIGNGHQSLGGAAFKIIKEKIAHIDPITIIGINQTTKILAKDLFEAGFSQINFVNRTFYKAEEMAEKYGAQAFSLDSMEEAISRSKCILSCTGAPGYIIDSDIINRVYSRSNLPQLLIDMAVPRDINSEGLVKAVEIIDMEGLKKYLEEEKKEILTDIPAAEKIITNETRLFENWNESQKDGAMNLIEEKIEMIRLELLNDSRLQISEDELQLLDKFSHTLVHRMKSTINQAVKMNLVETGINES